MIRSFSPKRPSEVIPLGISFRRIIQAGEGVSACTFRAVDSQTGEDAAGVLDTIPANTEAWPIVRQRAVGGEEGKTYLVEATVTTDKGRVLVGTAKLPICSAQ